MTDKIVAYISNICGLCKEGKAPGTVASFVALVFSFFTYYFLGKTTYFIFLILFVVLAFWAINKIQKKIGLGDYQWIGIDEWVGIWIANTFIFEINSRLNLNLKEIFILFLISFVIFRIIDIKKFIPPLKIINSSKNQTPLLVMLDDIIAGFYTYFIMLVILGFYDLHFLYFSLLIMAPAMLANATPVFIKMKYWNTPINEKLFGSHKTWRGFLGAIVIGTLLYVALVKYNFLPNDFNDFRTDSILTPFLIGFLFSFGAIGGDLLKSFFKRKVGIAPGESFTPWDQIDYVLGAIILTYPIFFYSFDKIVFMLILGGSVSAITHRMGYFMKMNDAKQ